MLGVVDGVVYAGGGEEAAALTFHSLLGKEQHSLIGVPILVEVPVLLVLNQE